MCIKKQNCVSIKRQKQNHMALLCSCIYKPDDSRFLIDNSPPIAPSNLSSENLTPTRVKFRFLFARFPQCRSVWAQPSLLLQSVSKTRRALTVIDLGAADSPSEVACQILPMRTRLVRERENHGNCMNVYEDVTFFCYAIGFLFVAFMLLWSCLCSWH